MSLEQVPRVRRVDGKRIVAPEYSAWQMMKNRCLNRHALDYGRMEVKGARMDPRWNTFAEFISDMGPKPDRSCSLCRHDNAVGYLPDNCYWGPAKRMSKAAPDTYNIPSAFKKWIVSPCV